MRISGGFWRGVSGWDALADMRGSVIVDWEDSYGVGGVGGGVLEWWEEVRWMREAEDHWARMTGSLRQRDVDRDCNEPRWLAGFRQFCCWS